MDKSENTRRISTTLLAGCLWLVTAGLGLEAIYDIKEIFYLIVANLGGSIQKAEVFVPPLMFFLGILYLGFIIVSTEYHLKRIGSKKSWRLFGWTIAVEVSLFIIYYFV